MYWSIPVKEWCDGIALQCGVMVVQGTHDEARDQITQRAAQLPDDYYVAPFAQMRGPFNTEAEARAI